MAAVPAVMHAAAAVPAFPPEEARNGGVYVDCFCSKFDPKLRHKYVGSDWKDVRARILQVQTRNHPKQPKWIRKVESVEPLHKATEVYPCNHLSVELLLTLELLLAAFFLNEKEPFGNWAYWTWSKWRWHANARGGPWSFDTPYPWHGATMPALDFVRGLLVSRGVLRKPTADETELRHQYAAITVEMNRRTAVGLFLKNHYSSRRKEMQQ